MSDEQERPKTATKIMSQWRERQARERYHTDPRFRAIVESIVHEVLGRHPQFQNREGHNLGLDMAATLLERIYTDDTELLAQRAEAERYRKIASDCIDFSVGPLVVFKPSS